MPNPSLFEKVEHDARMPVEPEEKLASVVVTRDKDGNLIMTLQNLDPYAAPTLLRAAAKLHEDQLVNK